MTKICCEGISGGQLAVYTLCILLCVYVYVLTLTELPHVIRLSRVGRNHRRLANLVSVALKELILEG